jgi:FKBP-type peptidyl-prolyl cis-trans isomerase FklB
MKIGLFAAALTVLVATQAVASDDVNLASTDAKISYAIGLQIGESLKAEGVPLDQAALSAAVADVINGADPRLSNEDIQKALVDFQEQKIQYMEQKANINKSKGAEYLTANKAKDGVKVTDSGLQYRVVTTGSGSSPSPTDMVTVHYRGTLINGEEFDSSYSRNEPATFPVNGVIQGWQEVLPMMKEGDKWEVTIPSGLAYGERGTGSGIGPNETLVFEIDLITVAAAPHGGASHSHGGSSPH